MSKRGRKPPLGSKINRILSEEIFQMRKNEASLRGPAPTPSSVDRLRAAFGLPQFGLPRFFFMPIFTVQMRLSAPR